MLIAKNILTHDYYLEVRQKGVNIFLYNEIDFIPPAKVITNEVFFNCSSQRVESTWYTWEVNDKLIRDFKIKFPKFFSIRDYDLTLAIHKAMYWSNLKTGFLSYSIENYFPNAKVYFAEKMHPSGKVGAIIRYIKALKFRPNLNYSQINKTDKNKFAIHLKNDFQLGFYLELIDKTINDDNFKVFVEPDVNEIYLKELGLNTLNVIKTSGIDAQIPLINPLKMSKEDSFALNIILMYWHEFGEHIETAESMIHDGLKAILINEAENGVYGAVVSEVFNKKGVKVYNTMNGIKSGEAQDSYVNFDYWFVWDQQMKHMLVNINKLPEHKLIVSGHLMEDLISNYQYHNSLNLDLKLMKDKKVSSIYTVKGKRYVKLKSMKFLFELIDEDESLVLIIRPHPGEKPEDYILPNKNLERIHFASYNSLNLNSSLHDLLLISDLAIVFGSTVALDAKWMGVPCISFEIREKSLIYCADNDKIKHVRTIEDFKTLVRSSLTKKVKSIEEIKSSVSDFILEEILMNN